MTTCSRSPSRPAVPHQSALLILLPTLTGAPGAEKLKAGPPRAVGLQGAGGAEQARQQHPDCWQQSSGPVLPTQTSGWNRCKPVGAGTSTGGALTALGC